MNKFNLQIATGLLGTIPIATGLLGGGDSANM
jgi:hypothetical protein